MARTEVQRKPQRENGVVDRSGVRHAGLSQLAQAVGRMIDVADGYVEEAAAAIRDGVRRVPHDVTGGRSALRRPTSPRQASVEDSSRTHLFAGLDETLRDVEALVESIRSVSDRTGLLVTRRGAPEEPADR